MSIEITHVRLSGGTGHEHIVRYRWRGNEDGKVGESNKSELVPWVDAGNRAYVGSGSGRVAVGVVNPRYGQPFLRTYADGKWTNNLLALPHF